MKKFSFLTIIVFAAVSSRAQTVSDSFYLHKFAQNIGKESYQMSVNSKNEAVYDIDFKFTDRGQAVPLKAQLVTLEDNDPVSLFIKGNTSRFSTINDSIRIEKKSVRIKADDSTYTEPSKPVAFPVGGYSPGTVQMVLIQYWKAHGRPKSIPMLPK